MQVLSTLWQLCSHVSCAFTGAIPHNQRIHDEFGYRDGGWDYNSSGQVGEGFGINPHEHKVVIYLNPEDTIYLKDCPFPAKIGVNTNKPFRDEKYCLIVFPVDGHSTTDNIMDWAKRNLFPLAEVYTYGHEATSGEWVAGSPVRSHP